MDNTLYVFLDDSGNFDFSDTGTDHLVLAAVTSLSPLNAARELQAVKYDLLSNGVDVECFHASPDSQFIRDRVFKTIASLRAIRVNYLWADKHKAHPNYQSPAAIYALFGKVLLQYVFNGYQESSFNHIVVIFDKALTNRDQQAFLKVVKPALKATGMSYRIYFHQTKADFNAQIADYAAWARYVALERDEQRPMQSISHIPQTDFDIFQTGRTQYY